MHAKYINNGTVEESLETILMLHVEWAINSPGEFSFVLPLYIDIEKLCYATLLNETGACCIPAFLGHE